MPADLHVARADEPAATFDRLVANLDAKTRELELMRIRALIVRDTSTGARRREARALLSEIEQHRAETARLRSWALMARDGVWRLELAPANDNAVPA